MGSPTEPSTSSPIRKRVLLITYYWPPSGGSGVQRWLKFAKYLPQNGWQPVIYCPENPDYTVLDESLEHDIPKEAEIIRGPIFEPYRFFRKITGQKEVIGTGLTSSGSNNSGPSLLKHLMIWIRGNVFIPDARMFWVKPSISRLSKYLIKNPVNAIVSTGPPHSCHLIALGLKKKFPQLKWIADFRDPWTTIDFYQDLKIGRIADRQHHKLEKLVVEKCDELIVVTPGMQEEFKQRFNRERIQYIANGYDAADYESLKELSSTAKDSNKQEKTFNICHIGTIPPARNPIALWKAIERLRNEHPQLRSRLKVELTGKVDSHILATLKESTISENVHHNVYVPHKDIPKVQAGADLLLLIINDSPNAKQILTGKLFEYLASSKPILCIGPTDSDSASVLKETGAGVVFGYHDVEGIYTYLRHCLLKGYDAELSRNKSAIFAYERNNLTKQLIHVIK